LSGLLPRRRVTEFSSLANQQTRYRTELIVANNNSSTIRRPLLDSRCTVGTKQQGNGFARQALEVNVAASVNADCDWSAHWVDALVATGQPDCYLPHGTYSFAKRHTTPGVPAPKRLLKPSSLATLGWECERVRSTWLPDGRTPRDVGDTTQTSSEGLPNNKRRQRRRLMGWRPSKGRLEARKPRCPRVWSSDRPAGRKMGC